MLKFFWIVTLLLSCIAAYQFITDILAAKSAPQQAAAAGMAIALVIIPYVFTRCVEKLSGQQAQRVSVINWPDKLNNS
ncbi:MAG: hypothetical protein HY059_11665 [Proteobacteria bacterium]|nr:hypothetical protein [Pseudomonadota bacterium]